MGVRTQPAMVEGKDDNAGMNVNSKAGFASLRIDKGVDSLIYISDTDMEEGHLQSTIQHKIYIKIYLRIRIAFLDQEVKPELYSHVSSSSFVSKSIRILLS
jgi:hypothetical protein